MTHFTEDGKDLALLHGRPGEDGETVLRYDSRPHVDVLSGSATSTYDPATGDLRLDYVHNGLSEVRIHGGNRPQLLLLIADDNTAGTFWRQDTASGPVLERGPELVRSASTAGGSLALTGDTSQPSDLQVWGPASVHTVAWDGVAVAMTPATDGSLSASTQLAGPVPYTLPDLSQNVWRYSPGSPESQPGFGDSAWTNADKIQTNSTTKPPAGQPVLTADDYGFHHGDVWSRGRRLARATHEGVLRTDVGDVLTHVPAVDVDQRAVVGRRLRHLRIADWVSRRC
jgi:Beta-galactosidase, domain 3